MLLFLGIGFKIFVKPKMLTNSIVQISYSSFPRNARFSDLIFCSFSLFFLLHSISARWNRTHSSVLRGPLNCHFLHGAFSNVLSSSFKCPHLCVCTSFGDNEYISLLLLFFMCLLFPLSDYWNLERWNCFSHFYSVWNSDLILLTLRHLWLCGTSLFSKIN